MSWGPAQGQLWLLVQRPVWDNSAFVDKSPPRWPHYSSKADQRLSGIVRAEDVAGLPQTIQRWLEHAGVIDRPRPASVHQTQTGLMRGRPDQPWMPVHAEQYFTTDPPGFQRIATLRMNPMMWVSGRDG